MGSSKSHTTAYNLWKGMGPYYCMFPNDFAREQIIKYTMEGDCILDPFGGRGTVAYEAEELGRTYLSYDINPVAYVWANTKVDPAPMRHVLARLGELNSMPKVKEKIEHRFFSLAYCIDVMEFLQKARCYLDWELSKIDRTLMAFILIAAQNKLGQGLSNQLPPFKAVGPEYAVRWWEKKGLVAPNCDPVKVLTAQIQRRYRAGTVCGVSESIKYGDVREYKPRNKVSLMLCSPPYVGRTNYVHDNWLRLWILGKFKIGDVGDGKYSNLKEYYALLEGVFKKATSLLTKQSTVVIRTGADNASLDATLTVGCALWGTNFNVVCNESIKTQTHVVNNKATKTNEATITFKLE